jgi:HSP20 family protein
MLTEEKTPTLVTPESTEAAPREPVARREMGLFDEMDRMFENFLQRGWLRPFDLEFPFRSEMMREPLGMRVPRVDIVERGDEFLVRAEIPGVDRKDLEVSLLDNAITLKGTSHKEEEKKGENYFHREIAQGSFTRTVVLPEEADTASARATFRDGVLVITLRKAEQRRRRTITVE